MTAVKSQSALPLAMGVDLTHPKKTELSLQESEKRYLLLLNSTAEAIYSLDAKGHCTFCNPACLRLLGYETPQNLLGKNMHAVMHHTRADGTPSPEQECGICTAVREGRASHASDEVLWRADGTNFSAECWSSPMYRADELVGTVVTFFDISDRKRAERGRLLLVDQERQARADAESAKTELLQTLDRISDGFFVLDRNWRYRYINEQGARYLGCRPEDLIGKNMRTQSLESADPGVYELYRKALEEQIPICEELYVRQWKRWFEVRIYPSAEGLSIVFHDNTERRQSQEQLQQTLDQLRSLSARLQTAREEERKQVARDLHDQIGQILTAVKMDVDWVGKRIHEDQANLRYRLGGTFALIRDATQSLRNICTELRPAVLDDLGLGAAIEWQANEFASRTGIACEVSVPPEDLVLDADRSTAVFRIFQEALTNVARHAQAKAVHASLAQRNGKVLLVVQDDGKGILDSDFAAANGSLGLLGMKERAQACGGELQVWGEPGKGTTVAVEIPVSVQD